MGDGLVRVGQGETIRVWMGLNRGWYEGFGS